MSNEGQFIITSANPRFESIYAATLRQAAIRERHIRASRGVVTRTGDRLPTHESGLLAYARIEAAMSDEPKTAVEIAYAVGICVETTRKYIKRHLDAGTIVRGQPRMTGQNGKHGVLTFVRGVQK